MPADPAAENTSPLLPGAEPWTSDGGPASVLVLHGFTGNPQSMRPLAEALAAASLTVSMPLLPGHGTTVEDMLSTRWSDWSAAADAAYEELSARCESVAVAGLSMGGTLTLWLASRHPEVRGIVLVNPLADGEAPGLVALVEQLRGLGEPLVPGIGSDIALEGSVESAYALTPVEPLLSLHGALAELRPTLGRIGDVSLDKPTTPPDSSHRWPLHSLVWQERCRGCRARPPMMTGAASRRPICTRLPLRSTGSRRRSTGRALSTCSSSTPASLPPPPPSLHNQDEARHSYSR